MNQIFFQRPALEVAPELLGKFLVRRWRGKEIAGMITEVEAYDGPTDRASHASRGETPRNTIMFGPAGHFYVYLCYGMHWMLNIVTGEEGYPAAVLIRGITSTNNEFVANKRISEYAKISGPGRVTSAFHIDGRLNGKFAAAESGLWVEDCPKIFRVQVRRMKIKRTPRIGVQYAGRWAGKPYRFLLR